MKDAENFDTIHARTAQTIKKLCTDISMDREILEDRPRCHSCGEFLEEEDFEYGRCPVCRSSVKG